MRENWKDYLAPGALAAGLLTFLIGVAVFGAPAYERETARSHVTEDTSQAAFFSTNEEVDDLGRESSGTRNSVVLSEEERNFFEAVIRRTREGEGKLPILLSASNIAEAEEPETSAQQEPQKPLSVADVMQEGGKVLDRPESLESAVLDLWNCKLKALVDATELSDPEQVPELIARWTDLTEADGGLYHYVCGYVYDRFCRRPSDFRESSFTKAVQSYEKAIECDGDVAVYHHFLGMVHFHFARNTKSPEFYDKAVPHYQAAAKCDPAWAMPLDGQGWCKFEKKDYDGAIKLLEEALKLDEKCIDALCCMIRCHERKYREVGGRVPEHALTALEYVKRTNQLLIEGEECCCGTNMNFSWMARALVKDLENQRDISPETHPHFFDRVELTAPIQRAYAYKQYDEVIRLTESALAHGDSIYFYGGNAPVSHAGYACLGYRAGAYFHKGEYQKTIDDTKAFLAHGHPLQDTLWFPVATNYAISLAHMKQWDEILELRTDDSIHDQTKRLVFSCYIALALARTGQKQELLDYMDHENSRLLGVKIAHTNYNASPDLFLEEFVSLYSEILLEESLKNGPHAVQFDDYRGRLETLANSWSLRGGGRYRLYFEMGKGFQEKRFHQHAAAYYEKFTANEPWNETALAGLLECYRQLQRENDVKRVATQLIAVNPNNVDYWIARVGQLTSHQLMYDTTYMNDLDRIVELTRKTGDGSQLVQALCRRGHIYECKLRHKDALKDYEEAMQLCDDPLQTWFVPVKKDEPRMNLAKAYLQIMMRSSSNYEEIVQWCDTLIEKGGDELMLLEIRAAAYEKGGQWQKAIDDYQVLATFGPSPSGELKHWQIYAKLANAYHSAADFDMAIESYTQAIELNPDDMNLYFSRKTTYEIRSNVGKGSEEQKQEDRELAEQDQKKGDELMKRRGGVYDIRTF